MFNVLGQLQSIERIIKTGELPYQDGGQLEGTEKKEELPQYGKPKS